MTSLSFVKLCKNNKLPTDGLIPWKFAVLGDCATQHLSSAIKGFAYAEGYAFEVFDADYDQVMAQTADPQSELYAFAPQTILFHLCTEKLYEAFCAVPENQRADFAVNRAAEIQQYWSMIAQHTNAAILQFTYIEEDDRVFGNYAWKVPQSFAFQVKKLNLLLAEACQKNKQVMLLDLNLLQAKMGRAKFHSDSLYYIAKMPITTEALPAVAEMVVSTVKAKNGSLKKCVILDLDNTLWGGTIGDDGLDGIQIGELGQGHAFTDLQRWLKELKKRGILLAVCSKNEEAAAKEPFLHHPEMVLRLSDFSIFVANWEDKAGNIRSIQKILNIGFDSMVFLDDNPFERNAVRSLLPEVTVPELPEDPACYLSYLKSLNLFETASFSSEDAGRTEQYRAEAGRAAAQQQFADYADYLKSLDMSAAAAPFDSFHYPRIAQLTQRSNQFNLRTVRYTEEEIRKIAEDDRCLTLYFCLKDKFGDYGLISVVILEKQEKSLFVSEWLMSCRVLKRGMEEFIINKMVQTAKQAGYEMLTGEYLPTRKNAMVADLYPRMGFTDAGDGRYRLDINAFTPFTVAIQEDTIHEQN